MDRDSAAIGQDFYSGEILPPIRRATGGSVDGEIIDLYPGFDRPIAYATDRPRQRLPKWLRLVPWLALLLVTLLAALVLLRGPIVGAVPQLSAIYTAIGLPTGEAGLAAENVRVVRVYSRGWAELSIDGTIANPTGRQVEVPPVTLVLRAGDGSELQTLSVTPSRSLLNPGTTARFTTEIAAPPPDAVDILVRIGEAPSLIVPIN